MCMSIEKIEPIGQGLRSYLKLFIRLHRNVKFIYLQIAIYFSFDGWDTLSIEEIEEATAREE